MAVEPETPDMVLRRLETRLGNENRRMIANLAAWAEVLGALGWKVAMALPNRPPLLNGDAAQWLAEIAPPAASWDQINVRLAAKPPARELKRTPRIRIWADTEAVGQSEPMPAVPLTRREGEVLRWLREGKTGPEIAIILGCAQRTVEGHVAKIYGKLGVRRRAELMFQTGGSES